MKPGNKWIAAALVCVFWAAAPAFAQDESSDREADIFGAAESAPAADAAPASTSRNAAPEAATASPAAGPTSGGDDREADMFGGGTDSQSSKPDEYNATPTPRVTEGLIGDKISLAERRLDIGGQLWMQFNTSLREDSTGQNTTLSGPHLLDIYGDARPNDRIRAYVRSRLSYNYANPPPLIPGLPANNQTIGIALDQLWLKFDLGQVVYITAGKQRIRWGSSRIWNPTDFLNSQRLNPLNVFDVRLGVDLLKVHLPIESLGWNFYAIADFDRMTSLDSIGGALRAELLFDQTEIALSAHARKDTPFRLGLDISSGLSIFDVRVESALVKGDRTRYWKGDFDLTTPIPSVPTSFSRENEWYPQVVGGLDFSVKYSEDDNILFGAEYFYNHAGYPDGRLTPWVLFQNDYTFLYAGKHYGALYVNLANPGSWNDTSFRLSNIGNLVDQTFISRLDIQQTLLTYISLNFFASVHYGKTGEFRLSLDLPATPFTNNQPIKVGAPITDIGLWILVNF
ncbi:MAG: hypothetical protein GMKNLPBB_02454 [Myxococcota bacterium]|nr:hypothetical protein [Myxococcota bacterium]